MNVITETWRQLIRRRLWPLAVLLVGALAAVPLAFAKSPAPAAPAPATAAAQSHDASSFVSLVDESAAPRRRVLGRTKDPFEPAPLPKVKKAKRHAKAAATATPTPTATPAPNVSSGAGASTPTAPIATPVPTPAVPMLPKGSLKVRFGKVAGATDGELPLVYLPKLGPLLDGDTPVLVFEHLTDKGKAAVFSIPGDVKAIGDGKCRPSGTDCETLTLHPQDTEFITVTGTDDQGQATSTQYELDLVGVLSKATPDPTAASGSSTSG